MAYALTPRLGNQRQLETAANAQAKRPAAPKPPPPPKPAAAPRSQPAAAPPQPTPSAPAPAAAPTYNYDDDPILQRIQGLTGRDRSFAQSEALAAKKQLAIDYGDEDLARLLGDDNTVKAAAMNPIGVRQQLRKGYDESVETFEEDLPSTLFYSGHRGKQLGRLATGYQESLARAGRDQQGLLSGIERALVAALSAADWRDQQAEADAVARALAANPGVDPGPDPGSLAELLEPRLRGGQGNRMFAV